MEPLQNAATAIARGEVDVVMFTTSMQLVHLLRIVAELGLEDDVGRELRRTVIASIGPTTSGELRRHGLSPDIEASHPKIGTLVREAAERSPAFAAVEESRLKAAPAHGHARGPIARSYCSGVSMSKNAPSSSTSTSPSRDACPRTTGFTPVEG